MSTLLIEKNIKVPMRDGLIASETRDQCQPAVNRVFHDAARPSRLILPIIER